ncbi:hypothetical protein [Marinilabilia salmonicolor]|uniref:hypothetical protein n=1 Tax=Marinilabilia salmonicolor TaxID=989 RepID=UPI00029B1FEC|nr:hypothetical protein [Marinilabilia salmonicolor]
MEKSIKQIKIIFWALLIIMLIMAAMAFYVTRQTGPLMDWTLSQKENLKSIILILALGGIPASYIFHSKKVKHIDPELPMAQKVNQFKISYLIKIITLEALSVLGILSYMITADNTFLYIFALLFVAYLINRPTKNGITEEIEPYIPEETDES